MNQISIIFPNACVSAGANVVSGLLGYKDHGHGLSIEAPGAGAMLPHVSPQGDIEQDWQEG